GQRTEKVGDAERPQGESQTKYHKGDLQGNKGAQGKGRGGRGQSWKDNKNGYGGSWGQPKHGGHQWGQSHQPPPADHRGHDPWSEENQVIDNSEDYQAALRMIAKLVIRHEHQIMIGRQDSGFVVFIQTGVPESLAKTTHMMAQSWHNMKANTPEKLTSPMRVILFQHLVKTVAAQFEKMLQTPSSRSSAIEMGLLNKNEDAIPGLRWDAEQRKHVEDPEVAQVPITTVREALQEILLLCTKPLVIARYHATRKLAAEYQGPTLTMMLEVGMRTHAQKRSQPTHCCPDAVIRLRLINTGNVCYANATLKCVVFAALTQGNLQAWFQGGMLRFVQGVLQQDGATAPWAHPFWVATMQGWRRPSQQHDGVEFLEFFLGKQAELRAKLEVHWQARAQSSGSYIGMDGGTSVPLLIQPPETRLQEDMYSVSVQEMVDAWHLQEAMHAALTAPQLLVIQVGRFAFDRSHGRATKRRFAVVPDIELRFPVFADDLHVNHSNYHLCSILVHKGLTPDSGHYQALLCGADTSRFWLADDGEAATPVDDASIMQFYPDVYMLIYKLTD
ncbi:usp-46, partial [Symbiodinium sp. CCMP2456]